MKAIKQEEKRVVKGYKIHDSIYQKALKRCKGDTPLAVRIEAFVKDIANPPKCKS